MHCRFVRFFVFSFFIGTFLACSKFVDANAGETRVNKISEKGEGTITFAKAGVSAGIKFGEPYPPVIGEATTFMLRFWDTKKGSADKGPFIDPGYTLKHPDFRLWMPPPMNHGSAKFKVEKVTDDGDVFFKVTNVLFTMEGEWEVQFNLRTAQGAKVDEGKIIHDQP